MYTILSTALLLFLVMDPVGNLPLFIAALEDHPDNRYKPIVIRESCIALGVLIIFMVAGGQLLKLLGLTQASLQLAGGIILFMIAIKMVFGGGAIGLHRQGTDPQVPINEPFIVPLAIPFIAGPAALSTCIVLGAQGAVPVYYSMPALVIAWVAGTLLLLCGRWAAHFLGTKVMLAVEALMGLLLVAMSAEIMIKGIKLAFNLQ